jgi:hypothetical protein
MHENLERRTSRNFVYKGYLLSIGSILSASDGENDVSIESKFRDRHIEVIIANIGGGDI